MSSYPSRILTILDLPEPQNLSVDFVYSFFTKDESVNDTASKHKGNIQQGEQISRCPRYNKITWAAVNMTTGKDAEELRNAKRHSQPRAKGADIFNASNIDKIQNEQTFSNLDFVGMNFQDLSLDEKLFDIVSGSSDIRGINDGSTLQASKKLSEKSRDSVNGNMLIDSFSKNSKTGVIFNTDKSNKKNIQSKFEKLKRLNVRAQINNKIVSTIVKNSAEDSLNIYADEMSGLMKEAEALQNFSIQKNSAMSIDAMNWDTSFTPIIISKMNPADSALEVTDIQGGGFIVDREEISDNGKIIGTKSMLSSGLNATAVIDQDVKYGATYRYRVRAVAVLTLPGTAEDGSLAIMTGLISSQFSNAKAVRCIENVPPPSPADFKPYWDYSNRSLCLMWSFPVNKQRDIKYFQVFRRKSFNEPFELLRMYDFDDSEIKIESSETIQENLIIKMSEPITHYIDAEFTKDSSYIYALCSVDAHGLTSNFSQQFQVTFDRFTNKLVTKIFSQSGAPKAYPNIFLNQDAFIDSIKTSGFKRMTVCFDPEYLDIYNNEKQDLGFLPFNDPNAIFKIQLINTDVQESQTLNINIVDKRTALIETALGSQGSQSTSKMTSTGISGLRPS